MRTFEAAMGHWPFILAAYDVSRDLLDGRHHGCPICGVEKKWFRFDDNDGKGSYYCNSCGAGAGIDLLMGVTGKDFRTVCDELDNMLGNTPTKEKRTTDMDPRPMLNRIRSESNRLDGTDPASQYLKGRGLPAASSLRWHPGLQYKQDDEPEAQYPAMLGVVESPEGQPVTYHRTFLEGGHKAPVSKPKMCLPGTRKLTGCAIRLHQAGRELCVAEGIESALCASEYFSLPAWSTLNANLMAKLEVPGSVERVLVVADHDENYTGHASAYDLARRLTLQGKHVEVFIPPRVGDDIVDHVG